MRTRYLAGDIVTRRKGLVMHKGVSLGGGRILHNTPFRGEHVCTEEEFAAGHRLYATNRSADERRRTLGRLGAWQPGRNYDLFSNNCEHTVTRHVHGTAHSPQLIGWAAALLAGAATLAITRSPTAAAASVVAAKSFAQRAIKSLR